MVEVDGQRHRRSGREVRGRRAVLQQAIGEDDLHDRRDRLQTRPVALKLARERNPADRLCPSLDHALEPGPVRLQRRAADRVDDGIDLVAFAERVERREGHAHLRPQRAEDELPAPARPHRLHELDVLPGVDRGAVDRRIVRQELGELGQRRLRLTRGDIDRRVDNRHTERLHRPDCGHGVLHEQVMVH